jgi:hypothetical protein
MGYLRLFRRIRIAPGVTVNLSKRGVSTSIGPRGAKVTLGTHGTRSTVGIPGTGLSYTSYSSSRTGGHARTRGAGGVAAGPTAAERYWLKQRAAALAPTAKLPGADRNWIGWGIGVTVFGVLALVGGAGGSAVLWLAIGAACVGVGALLRRQPRWQAVRLVRVARKSQDMNASEVLRQQALSVDPNCAQAIFDQAEHFYYRGSYAAAATMFNRYLTLVPSHLFARSQLADALSRDHQTDSALAVLMQLRGVPYYDESDQAAITAKMAWAFIDKGQYNQAIELANSVIGQKRNFSPGQLDCLFVRAVAGNMLGQRARALRDIDRLYALDPSYPNLESLRQSLLLATDPVIPENLPTRCANCGAPRGTSPACHYCGELTHAQVAPATPPVTAATLAGSEATP